VQAVTVQDRAAGAAGLTLSDIPHPHAAENDVIVRVYAAGFTPGELDWPGTWTDRAGRDRTPSVPGHELSGVVSELGYGTTGLTVGQRVFGLADWTRDGSLAEYAAVEAELLAAYDRSWAVYADALRRLDPTQLPSAFAGNALKLAQQEVAEHKAKRQPSLVRVTHRARVLLVTATDGVVQDNYTNHSVLLDPASGKPTEPDPNEVIYQRQSLKRIQGVWKVVEVIEEQRP
jgi:hypothetical protein